MPPRAPKIIERKLGRERADGLCHSDGLIEIDERLKGKARLDTLIHELVHSFDGSLTEEYVTKLATYIADNLYRNRVRVIEQD